MPNARIVRATRTPFNQRTNRPGIFKVEFESLDVKKEALNRSGLLRNYTVLGNKIMIRSSQPHEMRTQIGNWRTYLHETTQEDKFRVSKNGTLLVNGLPNRNDNQYTNVQSQGATANYQIRNGNQYPNMGNFPPQNQRPYDPRVRPLLDILNAAPPPPNNQQHFPPRPRNPTPAGVPPQPYPQNATYTAL